LRLQLAAAVALACIAEPAVSHAGSPWQIALDTLVYSDSDNVQILSPQLGVSRELDEDGGEASVRVVVDAISAASVDVVSQASTRFSEVRTEANLALSKRVSEVLAGGSYRVSSEPDYVSHSGYMSLQRRIKSADTTGRIGYGVTFDTVGMVGTPTSVFSESLTTHTADVGVTQVLGRRTLARLVYTLTVADGYMEKPYRFVPMFDAMALADAEANGVVIDADNVDDIRLPTKPAESVPDTRVRHALAARVMRYLPSFDASLRLDYQIYTDSWGLTAHVLEPAIHKQVSKSIIATWRARLYTQSAVSFWQREYTAEPNALPEWRTLDRELSPLTSISTAARAEMTLGDFSGYLEGMFMYTQFHDYLYLDDRIAVVGQLGLRWNP
jgi:hypothetical protein